MQKRKIFKIGLFVICLVISAYFGVRMAFFMSSPFETVHTGNEIDKVDTKGGDFIINTVVMGLDHDQTRTDTLLFVSYNSQNGKCFILSIPRDTYVNINGRKVLINTAYTEGGAEMTIKKVKDLVNLPVNYYVVFTFQDFRDVIDGLGGVEFDVRPKGYYYQDPYQDLYINIPGGHQVLDGKDAEGLVRYRADYPRADLERVEIQQKFVRAIIEQKFNAKYIKKIPKIYNDIKDSVKCNLSLDDILDYGKEILDKGIDTIDTYTLPTIASGAHLVPDKDAIESLISQYHGFAS